jgi:hypothetical protein
MEREMDCQKLIMVHARDLRVNKIVIFGIRGECCLGVVERRGNGPTGRLAEFCG